MWCVARLPEALSENWTGDGKVAAQCATGLSTRVQFSETGLAYRRFRFAIAALSTVAKPHQAA